MPAVDDRENPTLSAAALSSGSLGNGIWSTITRRIFAASRTPLARAMRNSGGVSTRPFARLSVESFSAQAMTRGAITGSCVARPDGVEAAAFAAMLAAAATMPAATRRIDFKRNPSCWQMRLQVPRKDTTENVRCGYLSVAPRGPRRCRRNEVGAERDEAAAEGKEKPLRHDGGLERPPELEQQDDER